MTMVEILLVEPAPSLRPCPRSLGAVLATAALLGLAACAEIGPVAPAESGAARPATESGVPAAAVDPPQTTPSASSQLAGLKSLSSVTLIARLGQPDFTRSDPPAELWQYRGATCVLDLFLYPEGGTLRVTHVVSRPRDRPDAPQNSCVPSGLPRPTSKS